MKNKRLRRLFRLGLAIVYLGLIVYTLALAISFLPSDDYSQRMYLIVAGLCAINVPIAVYRFIPPIKYRFQTKNASFLEVFELKNTYLNKTIGRILMALAILYSSRIEQQFFSLEMRFDLYPGLDDSVVGCLVILCLITLGYGIYSYRKSKK